MLPMRHSSLTIAWVRKEVIRKMQEEVQRMYPLETGGCLLGYWTGIFEEVVIEGCIGPGPKARHSRYSFKPDSEWQETQIARIYEESGRLCTYLGDWHSHIRGSLAMSWKDRRTLLRIASYPPARAPHPLMALIAGPPWKMRIWKVERPRRFLLSVVASECEIRAYA